MTLKKILPLVLGMAMLGESLLNDDRPLKRKKVKGKNHHKSKAQKLKKRERNKHKK